MLTPLFEMTMSNRIETMVTGCKISTYACNRLLVSFNQTLSCLTETAERLDERD